jgi:preprotein translocase subunit YajC
MENLQGALPLLAMLAVFYFLIIAPQMKKNKQEKKFVTTLKKGNRVITKSGMHAKILELNESNGTCVLETMAGKIKYETSSISSELSAKLNKEVK